VIQNGGGVGFANFLKVGRDFASQTLCSAHSGLTSHSTAVKGLKRVAQSRIGCGGAWTGQRLPSVEGGMGGQATGGVGELRP
jgi:hypothetical protein